MMASLFALFLLALLCILKGKKNGAFILIAFNLLLCLLMLLHHSVDLWNTGH